MDGCHWKEQSARLRNKIFWASAALSLKNGEHALICFPNDEDDEVHGSRGCEVYNSKIVMSSFATGYPHRYGKLALYRGKPTTVGSSKGDVRNKVETLDSSGWRLLSDFPKRYSKEFFYLSEFLRTIFEHVLMGLPSGSLLLAGGFNENGRARAIWLLENDIWKKIGDLENVNINNRNENMSSIKPDSSASAIMIEKSIVVVSGVAHPHAIERLDFEGNLLVDQQIIENTIPSANPVLLEVPARYCV